AWKVLNKAARPREKKWAGREPRPFHQIMGAEGVRWGARGRAGTSDYASMFIPALFQIAHIPDFRGVAAGQVKSAAPAICGNYWFPPPVPLTQHCRTGTAVLFCTAFIAATCLASPQTSSQLENRHDFEEGLINRRHRLVHGRGRPGRHC